MPMSWTSQDHERMLMIILDQFPGIKMKTVVEEWAKKYPGEDTPTLRAIEQHVTKLRKQNGVATPSPRKAAAATPRITPKTPKTTTAKTPTTSAKKRKAATPTMSEDDDSEPDLKSIKLERRESIPRRSKSVQPRTYDEDSDADEGEAEGNKENGSEHHAAKFHPAKFSHFGEEDDSVVSD